MNPWTPLVAATLGWGASVVLSRAVLQHGVDTFSLLPARMVFAIVTLGLVALFTGRFRRNTRLGWAKGGVLGVVGMGLPMSLMTIALEDLPVSIGGLLIALIPIATIAAAHFLVEGERFQARSLPGLLIALAGSAVLVGLGAGEIEGVGHLWRGVAFQVSGVALAGLGGALSRRFALQIPSSEMVVPQFAMGTLVLAAAYPIVGGSGFGDIAALDWGLIFLAGSVGTAVPFTSFLIGASMNPASRLALTGYTVPVVAVVLALLFLGEQLTATIMVGAILIIGGVVVAERTTGHVPEPGAATSA